MPHVAPDIREVFEMVTKQKPADPGALERQHTRQVRTMRNRKVGAFAVVAAIVVMAVAVILATRPGENQTTTGTQGTPTPVEVAKGFMDAYGTFDANRAIGYLAPNANVDQLISSIGETHDGPGLRLSIDWLRAVGYEQQLRSCRERGTSATATGVRCSFDLHLLRSNEIGKGPYGPAEIDFTISEGKIVYASGWNFDYEKAFSSEMWGPFDRWVSHCCPEDVAYMYKDETHSEPLLTDGSIRRWEVHTQGYVRYRNTWGP
jgi:hypothetical protein